MLLKIICNILFICLFTLFFQGEQKESSSTPPSTEFSKLTIRTKKPPPPPPKNGDSNKECQKVSTALLKMLEAR